MPKAILVVETHLSSPELADEYHRQYNDIHLKEIVSIEGFVAARRFEPWGHEGPFLAIYEIEADDLDAVRARLAEATKAGRLTTPVGVSTDPPPTVRYFQEIASCEG